MNNHEISASNKAVLMELGLSPDDSGIWASKLHNLRGRSKSEGKSCVLNFKEFITLAVQAGLTKPSQNGCRRGQYHLSRMGDIGPYSFDNCAFIPQEQNILDRTKNGGTEAMAIKLSSRNKYNDDGYANGGNKRSKFFRLVSPSGEIINGRNISDFSDRNDLDGNAMAEMCRGLRAYHKGWKGSYV